jgi:hypothetical protein
MIDDDSDLKRMFAAQREIDEQLAPAFEEIAEGNFARHVNTARSGTAQAAQCHTDSPESLRSSANNASQCCHAARKSTSIAMAFASVAIVLVLKEAIL